MSIQYRGTKEGTHSGLISTHESIRIKRVHTVPPNYRLAARLNYNISLSISTSIKYSICKVRKAQ